MGRDEQPSMSIGPTYLELGAQGVFGALLAYFRTTAGARPCRPQPPPGVNV